IGRRAGYEIAVTTGRQAHISARGMDTVTACQSAGLPGEVIVLIGGDDEQSVIAGDAFACQPSKKFPKRDVIGRELLHVTGFAGSEAAGAGVVVVRIRDVRIDHRHSRFEQGCDVSERLRSSWVESRETRITAAVSDRIAI